MIYPNNYEQKIGFNEVRGLLSGHCQSSLGKELVENTCFSYDADIVNEELEQTREMRRIQEEGDFPLTNFFDVRESVSHIRLEGTHLEEEELWYLRQSLEAISKIVDYLGASRSNSSESSSISKDSEDAQTEEQIPYPALNRLASQVVTFPRIIQQVDQILDKFGHMRDTALAGIASHTPRAGPLGRQHIENSVRDIKKRSGRGTGRKRRDSHHARRPPSHPCGPGHETAYRRHRPRRVGQWSHRLH
jgi:DNA mismatch repair protein MutS2